MSGPADKTSAADKAADDLLASTWLAEEKSAQGPSRRTPAFVRRLGPALPWAALFVFGLVLVRTAWLCDDAYITFRTVYNFVNGYGLTWNVAERVQAYTHPLWMLFLSGFYALTGEMYFTPLLLSIVLALAGAWLFAFKVARTRGGAVAGLCIWIGSRAYVDFSTGGLENPLAHLLLLLLFVALMHGWRAWIVGLLCSGLLLLRTDLVLLLLPVLVVWWRSKAQQKLRPFLLGLAPLFLWHGFSLLYYGYLFPNTAQAKLGTGIATLSLARQGLVYLQESLHFDPLTLPVILLGCLGTIWLEWRQRAMALGIVLYLLYVIGIGGDFMSGRFLTVELVWAGALLIRALERLPRAVEWSLAVPLLVAGLLAPYPSLTSGADYGLERGNDFSDLEKAAAEIVGADGISDERAWHYRLTGLLRVQFDGWRPIAPLAEHPKYQEVQRLLASGKKVITTGAIGLRGFYLGPGVHVIDFNALADPLLSKLPVAHPDDWRISHFKRPIPCGYEKSVESGENRLRDENLAGVYDAVRLVTRGPLFSGARLWQIVLLHTGRYGDELEAYENDEGCP